MRLFSRLRAKRNKPSRIGAQRTFSLERLEDRSMLAAYAVINTLDDGPGSLRQAILDANANPGADVIAFEVAGTIQLASPLPEITGEVNIDGTTAPNYDDTPLVEIDFNGAAGLQFSADAAGSALRSLSLVNANGNGITLNGGSNLRISGNYIGLSLDGTTVAANSGHGLALVGTTSSTIESNVISGNGGNGIALYGANDNEIAMNSIGTDVTGNVDLGNGQNGVLITAGSAGNMLGGEATGGNDPTEGVFVRPPLGNLISGNDAHGVLITGQATGNQISGNFIGTTASGNAALGNSLDGVAIVEAHGNSLIGCLFEQNPFVFYNVISGNGGNGVRVTDSNNTTIQANFLGMGANNATAVSNALNGVLVEGTSAHTTMGGPIPLGNVSAANGQNGIVVRDTASYFTSYNTFCGLAAFSDDPSFGNALNGMLITSTGGNILIRTNVVASNGDNGIEISGDARDIRVVGNIIGLNTNGSSAMGNADNGIEISGTARDIVIGGPQPTFNVIPQNTISANGGNGVAVLGNAQQITINHSYIGTDLEGLNALGNAKAGVLLGAGTSGNQVGSAEAELLTLISGNSGHGVELQSTTDNVVMGAYIGTSFHGDLPLPNAGSGVFIADSYNNLIGVQAVFLSMRMFLSSNADAESGDTGAPNLMAYNLQDGVRVQSGAGNAIGQNSIRDNALLGIDLAPGANDDISAPVITSVEWLPSSLIVSGSLSSTPNSAFVVEFFASEEGTSSGEFYLGQLWIATNSAGVATFTFESDLPPDGAQVITATATDPSNNTSEFS